MQEVIVYRNPMEAAIWQYVMSASLSASFFPVICGVVVFFAVMLTAHNLISKRYGTYGKRGRISTNISLVLAAACGIGTIWYMAI